MVGSGSRRSVIFFYGSIKMSACSKKISRLTWRGNFKSKNSWGNLMKWLLASASLSIFALASCGVTVDNVARDYDADVEALAAASPKPTALDLEPNSAGASLSSTMYIHKSNSRHRL